MDISVILEKLQDMGYIRLNRIIGEWYQTYCPFHNEGQERKPSAGVLLHSQRRNGQTYPEGMFHCFTCSKVCTLPEMITEILKSRSITKTGLEWLKENVEGFDGKNDSGFNYLISRELMESLNNKYAIEYIQSKIQPEVNAFISEEELSKYRYTVPYMYERGMTDEIIEAYDIGFQADWVPPGRKRAVPCITFPVRDKSGRTLFLCRRSIEGKMYNYPEGVIKPLYGIDMIPKDCKSLIICESCINALTAVRYGHVAVALLGTGNVYQLQQLKELGMYEFTLCFDGDEAGKKATRKLKNALKSNAIIWTMHMPDGKDANDCDFETFEQLYSERD